MAYRFRARERVARGLRRVAHEQLRQATTGLRQQGADDRDAAVHEARKSIKKARALLRLFRPVLDKSVVIRDDRALRDAGRLLSATRDSRVLLDTLQRLQRREPRLAEVAEQVEAYLSRSQRVQARGDSAVLEKTAAAIEGVRGNVRSWRPNAKGWSAIAPGLLRIYRRGAKASAQAFSRGEDTTAALHDFRKRVKELWYALRLLEPSWPELLSAEVGEAKRLSELLGDDHDLAVFGEAVAAAGDEVPEVDLLLTAAGELSGELRGGALSLARRLYAETPKAMLARHQLYWRRWRREIRAVKS